MIIPIATSRFSNETWEQNCGYREKIQHKGCVYGAPLQISSKVPSQQLVFIVEMNNSTNKIEGVGLIRNIYQSDKYYKVYPNGNYNRYVYKSDYRLDRDVLERYNSQLVQTLEYILFKEKTHMKRGSGLTLIPEKLLKHKMCENKNISQDIKQIFQKFYEKEVTENKELKIEN
jgi:hypothetical protein